MTLRRPLSEAVPRVVHSITATSRQENASGENLLLLCKLPKATYSSSPVCRIPLSTPCLTAEVEEAVGKKENDRAVKPGGSPSTGCSKFSLSFSLLIPFQSIPKECKGKNKWKIVKVKFRSPYKKSA